MIRVHRDAVISTLEGELPGAVFKSYSAANRTRYAVVFIAKSGMVRSRFASAQNREIFTVTVHSVGQDEDLCLWVQERVNRLTGRRLDVAGRRLWPVTYVTGRPPDLDDDGTSPLWFSVSQFDIVSDPV